MGSTAGTVSMVQTTGGIVSKHHHLCIQENPKALRMTRRVIPKDEIHALRYVETVVQVCPLRAALAASPNAYARA